MAVFTRSHVITFGSIHFPASGGPTSRASRMAGRPPGGPVPPASGGGGGFTPPPRSSFTTLRKSSTNDGALVTPATFLPNRSNEGRPAKPTLSGVAIDAAVANPARTLSGIMGAFRGRCHGTGAVASITQSPNRLPIASSARRTALPASSQDRPAACGLFASSIPPVTDSCRSSLKLTASSPDNPSTPAAPPPAWSHSESPSVPSTPDPPCSARHGASSLSRCTTSETSGLSTAARFWGSVRSSPLDADHSPHLGLESASATRLVDLLVREVLLAASREGPCAGRSASPSRDQE